MFMAVLTDSKGSLKGKHSNFTAVFLKLKHTYVFSRVQKRVSFSKLKKYFLKRWALPSYIYIYDPSYMYVYIYIHIHIHI